MVTVPEASDTANTLQAVSASQAPPTSRPVQLTKEDSYAVALGNMVSPGSMPSLKQQGQESVV
jgi:hypothetical protein